MNIWVLNLSDLHLGSATSIWPPDFKDSNGQFKNLNKGQRYLYDNWEAMKRQVIEMTGGKLAVLNVIGDSVQGTNMKEDGDYIVEPNMAYQGRAAIHLLREYAEMADMVNVFRGSRYHVGVQGETEETVGFALGATQNDFGRYCWNWMPELHVGPVVFDIAHHQSVTIVNRSMPLEREQRFNQGLWSLKNPANIILRGHAHVGSVVDVDGDVAIGLPPMQIQTSFAELSKVPNRYCTKFLGMCLIHIMPEREGTLLPIFEIHMLRFPHPPLAVRNWEPPEKDEGWTKRLLNRISQ
jgi:hypothetical protein